jgi:hypothetical protein
VQKLTGAAHFPNNEFDEAAGALVGALACPQTAAGTTQAQKNTATKTSRKHRTMSISPVSQASARSGNLSATGVQRKSTHFTMGDIRCQDAGFCNHKRK